MTIYEIWQYFVYGVTLWIPFSWILAFFAAFTVYPIYEWINGRDDEFLQRVFFWLPRGPWVKFVFWVWVVHLTIVWWNSDIPFAPACSSQYEDCDHGLF